MANHASTRTTQLYDRRAEEVTLDERRGGEDIGLNSTLASQVRAQRQTGVVTAKLCILAIGALHPDSALSSDTQRADFLQKTYFVESPSFGIRLPGLLPEDSSP